MLFRKNFAHPIECVDIGRRLVVPDSHDAREAKRISAFVPGGPLEVVEGHLDHYRGLDATVRAEIFHRMFQKIIGVFPYLGIGQPGIGLADIQ